MDIGGFIAGVVQTVLGNWIAMGVGVMLAAAYAYCVRHLGRKNWPVTVALGVFVLACIVITLAGISILYSGEGSNRQIQERDRWEYKISKAQERIIGKSFRNERIVLDGKSFVNCRFDNVTMEYNGTAPFELLSNSFGGLILTSKNPGILAMVLALDNLKFLAPHIQVIRN